jgi:dTMP kinase
MFVVFEGLDGVGKSTQVELLRDALDLRRIPREVVREPGGCEISEDIRSLLLAYRSEDMTEISSFLLFCASRAEVTKQVIVPALQKGLWVISDRYTGSSYAYQGLGNLLVLTLGSTILSILCRESALEVIPDVVFLLHDTDHERLLQFRQDHLKVTDPRDQESDDFYKRVLIGYNEYSSPEFKSYYPDYYKHIVVIPPYGTPEEVHQQVWDALKQLT